jgi:hypothetical protein
MNCAEARTHLPSLVYGDLAPAAADAVRRHLAGCAACRQHHADLQQLRHALDSVPAPSVQVDLPRLYREAAERQERRARRWRRAALACCAAAALLLLVVGLRLQVRVDAHQLIVRWGSAPEPLAGVPAPPRDAPPPDTPDALALAEARERLELMSNLIHALNEDLEARDAQQKQALKRLQARLDEMQFQGNVRWGETERNIAALYAAHFGPTKKGE